MIMENVLSLEEKVKQLINKKLSICSCNPCTCSIPKKDEYFQELKNILKIQNFEKFKTETQFQIKTLTKKESDHAKTNKPRFAEQRKAI
jgi:hypothetical protein